MTERTDAANFEGQFLAGKLDKALAENEQLRLSLRHWGDRAEIAEAEVERLRAILYKT